MEAYINETQAARGYILLDFRCDTDQKHRIRAQIFSDELNFIYQ